mgnify:CR=1 FL=1
MRYLIGSLLAAAAAVLNGAAEHAAAVAPAE